MVSTESVFQMDVLKHGAWSMEHGAWCMVHGAWSMVHGAWSELGARSQGRKVAGYKLQVAGCRLQGCVGIGFRGIKFCRLFTGSCGSTGCNSKPGC